MTSDQRSANWWRSAVVYQIYVRSFADSNGDGIGDLPGVLSRLPYLDALGVDAIWLTPFYPSPWADGGYDVADYRNVDVRLGALRDFENLCLQAHELDVKIIVDIVPNHTSNEHPWFVSALASAAGSPERDRYIFRPGTGPAGASPPSDWRSHFGGSAWQRVPDGQWYCHLFSPEQPDLNWHNPEVREYFLDTLRFWADHGADGFRVDAAHTLIKELADPLLSQPNLDLDLPSDGTNPLYDRDELHELYRTWRAVFDEYDPPRTGIAETWYPSTDRAYLYARSSELGQVFDFNLSKTAWSRDAYRTTICRTLEQSTKHVDVGLTWVLSSHDIVRHATRLALPPGIDIDEWLLSDGSRPPIDRDIATRRARAATLLMLGLPGSPYLYQGEELGLPECADLPRSVLTDPMWVRSAGKTKGRDGCRVPIPWNRSGPSFGFSRGDAWLPQPPSWAGLSVEAQEWSDDSTLEMYRAAMQIRRKWNTDDTEVQWLSEDNDRVLHYRRSNRWECLTNFGPGSLRLPRGTLALSSISIEGDLLPEDTTVWLTP